MGYYTRYYITLATENVPTETRMQIDEAIRAFQLWDFESYQCENWFAEDKWYDHVADMAKLSAQFPGVLFFVHGEGENGAEDLWNEYYLDGRFQRCDAEIVYPPYDPAKLRPVDYERGD